MSAVEELCQTRSFSLLYTQPQVISRLKTMYRKSVAPKGMCMQWLYTAEGRTDKYNIIPALIWVVTVVIEEAFMVSTRSNGRS